MPSSGPSKGLGHIGYQESYQSTVTYFALVLGNKHLLDPTATGTQPSPESSASSLPLEEGRYPRRRHQFSLEAPEFINKVHSLIKKGMRHRDRSGVSEFWCSYFTGPYICDGLCRLFWSVRSCKLFCQPPKRLCCSISDFVGAIAKPRVSQQPKGYLTPQHLFPVPSSESTGESEGQYDAQNLAPSLTTRQSQNKK